MQSCSVCLMVVITPIIRSISHANRLLWKRHCDPREKHPIWLYTCIVKVIVKKLELFVKKISYSNCDKTIPLWQSVIDCCINCPEVITAMSNGISGGESSEVTALIEVCDGQHGAHSRRVKKVDP